VALGGMHRAKVQGGLGSYQETLVLQVAGGRRMIWGLLEEQA